MALCIVSLARLPLSRSSQQSFKHSIPDRDSLDLPRRLRVLRRYRWAALHPARDWNVWRCYGSFKNNGQDVRYLEGEVWWRWETRVQAT